MDGLRCGFSDAHVGRLSRLAGYLYREGLCFPERRGVDVETVGGAGDLVGLRAHVDLSDWAKVLPIATGESAKVADADRLDGGLARQVHYRGHPRGVIAGGDGHQRLGLR